MEGFCQRLGKSLGEWGKKGGKTGGSQEDETKKGAKTEPSQGEETKKGAKTEGSQGVTLDSADTNGVTASKAYHNTTDVGREINGTTSNEDSKEAATDVDREIDGASSSEDRKDAYVSLDEKINGTTSSADSNLSVPLDSRKDESIVNSKEDKPSRITDS